MIDSGKRFNFKYEGDIKLKGKYEIRELVKLERKKGIYIGSW